MAKTPRTIARDSVFRRLGPTEQAPPQGVATQEPPTHQTAVWLGDEEVQWLDTCCQEIRRGGWRSITRSALIRALIRAAMDQPRDLSGVSGEDELTQRLTAPS